MKQTTKNKPTLTSQKTRGVPEMNYDALVAAIANAHEETQRSAVQAVNLRLTLRNWLIGHYIVEYEQHGSDRAQYGAKLLDELAKDLRRRVGKGFSKRYLEMFRRFYLCYPIAKTVFSQFQLPLPLITSTKAKALSEQEEAYFVRLFQRLPWAHFVEFIRLNDPLKREFYEVEALRNRWSVRELKRQIGSLLFERIGLSVDKDGVLALANQSVAPDHPLELIRDPYVFEFLGLQQEQRYTESQIEQALLDHLQEFLLELGKGFCFVGRQRRITFDNEHYYIDLLLYNRKLKCLFAIDLMRGAFKHEYAGAMNFYLNYLKAEEMEAGENPPIGLILCTDKNETHVEYALGGLSNRVFVSRYLLHLPNKTELEAFVAGVRRKLEKES
jgi:predicted nuclease of restriction endonuclease-like (RecB) superfamily